MSIYKKTIIITALFFLCIGASLPLSFGDDVIWGSDEGLKRLSTMFDGYNGRYFGNIIILAITRNTLLRVLLYTVINTGIVVLISKIANVELATLFCTKIIRSLFYLDGYFIFY